MTVRIQAASLRPGQYVLIHNGRLDLAGYVHMVFDIGGSWTVVLEVERGPNGMVLDTQSVLLRPGHVIHVIKDHADASELGERLTDSPWPVARDKDGNLIFSINEPPTILVYREKP